MTEDISRAFLLISKIIQSIANGIPISRKEPEYASFDELAFSFADPLKEFYITVSVPLSLLSFLLLISIFNKRMSRMEDLFSLHTLRILPK